MEEHTTYLDVNITTSGWTGGCLACRLTLACRCVFHFYLNLKYAWIRQASVAA